MNFSGIIKNRKTSLLLLIVFAVIQLGVLSKIVFTKEQTLKSGKTFKFLTEPVDPTDPFRGKYVALGFIEDEYYNNHSWQKDEDVYVIIQNDNKGFAMIKNLSREEPDQYTDFIKAKIERAKSDKVTIKYPFERFYMEESKAPQAEKIYFETNQNDLNSITYTIVKVNKGNTVLVDVMIDGTSLKDLAQ